MIGKTISHYKIIEKIGEGGMGIVYKAEDTKLKRMVALKFLPQHFLSSGEEKSRFIQEAQAVAALNHTNICTIHEIDEHDGQTFIAMEYIEGQSLKDKIAGVGAKDPSPLPVEEALDITIQIATGQFREKANDIQDIGKKLKVKTILEGSVRKSGNRLRITAQLINVDDGYHLWSERFDREMEDIFAIQDEISMTIVDKLKVNLLKEEKAKANALRAIEIDDMLAEAYTSLGWINYLYDWDWT